MKMYFKIFYYLLFFFLKKNLNIVNIINKKKIKNKFFQIFFFKQKKKIEKMNFLLKNNKNNFLSYFLILKSCNEDNLIKKKYMYNLININNKFFKKNFFFNYYNLYLSFFNENFLLNSNFYIKYYYNFFFNNIKISIKNSIFLKIQFFKFFKIIYYSLFLNLKPFLINNKNFNFLNIYIDFLYKKKKYDYIFILNPFIKIKFLKNLKKLKIPIFSIVDSSININYIDYPIFINEINIFNIYFFSCLFQYNFFFNQNIKKIYFKKFYMNLKNLNYLKEILLKNKYIN